MVIFFHRWNGNKGEDENFPYCFEKCVSCRSLWVYEVLFGLHGKIQILWFFINQHACILDVFWPHTTPLDVVCWVERCMEVELIHLYETTTNIKAAPQMIQYCSADTIHHLGSLNRVYSGDKVPESTYPLVQDFNHQQYYHNLKGIHFSVASFTDLFLGSSNCLEKQMSSNYMIMSWVVPPPSNCGKWRFIGITY